MLYSVNFDRDLYEDYDLDIEVRKIDIPYKNKLMNFPLLMQQKIASKYISKHEIYNSHMFPCHSLNLENNIWIPQEPARILYDLKYLMDKEGFSKKALYNISTPLLRYIDKKSYKASKTIANSNYSKNYLEEVYQINIEDIVYPGVDVDRFERDKTKKEDNVILLVSRLYKEKNIDIGIKALSLLDESYVLKIVGKGPYKEELQKLSEKLNVSERIVFYDFVDDQTLTSLLRKHSVLFSCPIRNLSE